MTITAILLLAALLPAQPIRPTEWITPEDYPFSALQRGLGGYTGFRLTVGANGRPIRCEITFESQSSDLDALTCKVMMKRAKFVPALDMAGKPIASIYRDTTRWWTTGMKPLANQPAREEIELTVRALPAGISAPARSRVGFLVDPLGVMSECTPLLAMGSANDAEREEGQKIADKLGKISCAQIVANIKATPAQDESGQNVDSVQTATVLFNSEPH